jgi:signal recognition particle receptor subunit beta
MLPDVDHPIWIQFVTGKKPVQSNKATINMLIQSNKMNYERDPSPENVKYLAEKTHKFLKQFEAIFYNEIYKILS